MGFDDLGPSSPDIMAEFTGDALSRPSGFIAEWVLLVALLAVAASLLGYRASAAKSLGNTLKSGTAVVGSAAPDFHFVRIGATSTNLDSLSAIEGKPLLVNFFATWCSPCKAEIPQIERLYRAHTHEGLRVIGIDQQESVGAVRKFARTYGVTFSLAADTGEGALAYDIGSIPTSVFIDSSGRVRVIYRGQMSSPEMAEALKTILK